jgi:cytochrome c oxidase subunit 2
VAAIAALAAGVAVVTAGCQSNAFTRQGMLPPVTTQGRITLHLWQGSWIAAWCVGLVVWGGIIWAVVFHRKRSDQLPRQVRYNLPIEILYTVLPFIMVGILFYFTARDENVIDRLPAHPQVVVNVTGFQWSWQFQYPQYPVLGKGGAPVSPAQMVAETGNMWNPNRPDTQQLQHLPQLYVPEHEWVQFNLTSLDVDHSFWVPPFEFKRDLLPGHPNHFAIWATSTGTFIGHCSELCGVYHSRMLFQITIVTPAQFRHWIRTQQLAQGSAH